MGEIRGTLPLQVIDHYPSSFIPLNPVMFHVKQHERFLVSASSYRDEWSIIYMQDGRSGLVPTDSILVSQDTLMFKMAYSDSLFPFYSSSSNWALSRYSDTGWGAALVWIQDWNTRIPEDTCYNLAFWTQRAVEGDTFALRVVLDEQIGEGSAFGQFETNKWKVINAWSDSALAEFALAEGQRIRMGKYNTLNLYRWFINDLYSPFYDSVSWLHAYYARYYPMTYAIIMWSKHGSAMTSKEYRTFRKMIDEQKISRKVRRTAEW